MPLMSATEQDASNEWDRMREISRTRREVGEVLIGELGRANASRRVQSIVAGIDYYLDLRTDRPLMDVVKRGTMS